jgi:dolichol-phosphate mannosyltransferase
VGNFSLISRKVADAFLQVSELNRQYLLVLYWLGFDREIVDVRGDERHAGESSYGVRKLIQVALDGLFFHTTLLLGWIVVAGVVAATLGILLALVIVVAHFAGADQPVGYASLATIVLVMGGAILASVGVAAMYAGRIHEQVKGRPLYLVDDESEAGESRDRLPAATGRGTQRP